VGRDFSPLFFTKSNEFHYCVTTAYGREPLLAALKLSVVEGPLCGQDRTVAFSQCLWPESTHSRHVAAILHGIIHFAGKRR